MTEAMEQALASDCTAIVRDWRKLVCKSDLNYF
jgi:hypothetical protein